MDVIQPDFSSVIKVKSEGKPKEMLTVQHDGPQTYVKINSSSLSLIQTCARKSFYSLHEKWKSRAGSPPLIYGSAIHKALEVFYLHRAKDRSLPRDFEEVAPLLAYGNETEDKHFIYDAIRAFVIAMEPLKNLSPTTARGYPEPRTIESGVWVLMHYFKTYANDVYVIHSDDKGPIVERNFSIPFYEDKMLRIDLFGQIDFALRNEATGEILVGDHKTASRMGDQFLDRVKPNHQYTGYLIGAHRTLGVNGEHFLVNGIEVKARPKTSKGGPPTFTRQVTRRSAGDFEEFKEALLDAVNSYLRWEATNSWPIGVVDACANYGRCQYLDVCSQPNELRRNILEAKFNREVTT